MRTRVLGLERRSLALPALLGLGVSLLYVLAMDQGQLLSVVQGAVAFQQNFIHELLHDGRHVMGIPCH
jgi:hypothetical protein